MRKLATLMFVLAAANAADAKPKAKGKSVKVHMDNAAKAHKAGKFEVALTELQAAYAIDPQPKLLFAIAQVHAKLDNCEAAIDYYEKFAATQKDKSKQSIVKQAIDACKKKLDDAKPDKPESTVFRAKKPPPEELPTADAKDKPEAKPEEPKPEQKISTTPEPAETKPEPKPTEIKAFDDPPPRAKPAPAPAPVAVKTTSEPTHSPWYRDPLGDALVITGVGATIASVLVFRSAQNDLDAAEQAQFLADYEQHHTDAERKELYTWILAGTGIALVSAGVLRYVTRDSRRESRSVSFVPTHDGGLITWSGGF